MEQIFLGNSKTGQPVSISKNSTNGHVLVTGVSGQGKSTLLHSMEMYLGKSGSAGILVINYNGTHDSANVSSHIQSEFSQYTNYIDIKKDGLPLPLWPYHNDTVDHSSDDTNFVASALSSCCFLGLRQKACLRNAIRLAYTNRFQYTDHLESIRLALSALETEKEYRSIVFSITQNLHFLDLTKIIPRPDLLWPRINVLDLSGFDFESQIILTELTLSILWNQSVNRNSSSNEIFVFLDEFQTLNLKSSYAPLPTILREGRKRRINLIMATQTLAAFDKAQNSILDNASTKIRFRQSESDAREYCKYLPLSKEERLRRCALLTNLNRGECIVEGALNHDGIESTKPLLIRVP